MTAFTYENKMSHLPNLAEKRDAKLSEKELDKGKDSSRNLILASTCS